MSQPNYSDLERGKREPSISQLKKFAEILEVPLEELVYGSEDAQQMKRKYGEVDHLTPKKPMRDEDKDTYIKILEGQLRRFWQSQDEVNKQTNKQTNKP